MYSSSAILSCFLIFVWNISSGYSTSKICTGCNQKVINFHAVVDEMFTLKHTGKSVVTYTPATTNATAIGGILDNELYKLYKITYYWETCHLITDTYKLHTRFIYFNDKYESYENAVNYPDGIVQINSAVNANSPVDNPQFEGFEKAFKEIRYPGTFTHIKSLLTYDWFTNFPPYSTFKHYKSEYFDDESGKKYPCATTTVAQSMPLRNFISCKQFRETFGSLKDYWGKPLDNPQVPNYPTSLVKVTLGVFIKPVQN